MYLPMPLLISIFCSNGRVKRKEDRRNGKMKGNERTTEIIEGQKTKNENNDRTKRNEASQVKWKGTNERNNQRDRKRNQRERRLTNSKTKATKRPTAVRPPPENSHVWWADTFARVTQTRAGQGEFRASRVWWVVLILVIRIRRIRVLTRSSPGEACHRELRGARTFAPPTYI